MSYHLTRGRPLSRQLPALLEEELAAALEALAPATPDAEAVHQARKCVKKSRALLQLVKGGLGRDYDREEERLSVSAHALSGLRDADASLETLQQLAVVCSGVLKPGITRGIATGLAGRTRATRAGAEESLALAREALNRALRSAPGLVRGVATHSEVRKGVARGYRLARRAYERLDSESGTADFHRWRRRVKNHWYHMRLLEELHPGPRSRAGRLEELEQRLGEDHNLALLRGIILADPERYGAPGGTTLALGCVVRQQHQLRSDALSLGRRLFGQRSRDFGRQWRDWWK